MNDGHSKSAMSLGDCRANDGLPVRLEHDEATKNGWTVISMKDDWKRIFAFD